MSVENFRDIIIPSIKSFIGAPIIEADQTEDRLDEPHATYKVTLPYAKGVGREDQRIAEYADHAEVEFLEQYKATISINTYAFDDPNNGIFDLSVNMAQSIYDWFTFYGIELLDQQNIVVIELSDIANRDAIIVEDYERRHGFDVILRMSKKMSKDVGYYEGIRGITD